MVTILVSFTLMTYPDQNDDPDNDDDDAGAINYAGWVMTLMMMMTMTTTMTMMMMTMMTMMMKTALTAIMTLAGLGFHMQMSTRATRSSVRPTRSNPLLDDQYSTPILHLFGPKHGDKTNKMKPIFTWPSVAITQLFTPPPMLNSNNDNFTSNEWDYWKIGTDFPRLGRKMNPILVKTFETEESCWCLDGQSSPTFDPQACVHFDKNLLFYSQCKYSPFFTQYHISNPI